MPLTLIILCGHPLNSFPDFPDLVLISPDIVLCWVTTTKTIERRLTSELCIVLSRIRLWTVALQAALFMEFSSKILEWVAISYSRGSFPPRDQTWVSCISCTGSRFFTTTPPGKPHLWAYVFSALSLWLTDTSFKVCKLEFEIHPT